MTKRIFCLVTVTFLTLTISIPVFAANGDGFGNDIFTDQATENITTKPDDKQKPNNKVVSKPKKGKVIKVTNIKGKRAKVKIKLIKGARGYQIQYATNSKFKKSKRVTTTKRIYTLKRLKKNKKYRIRVRAYKMDNGKRLYGKWSVVKKVKIRK